MMYVEFMKNFRLDDSRSWWLLNSFRSDEPKKFDSFFLHMAYVEFMKNFHVPDSNDVMAIRLLSASWAQKRWIPTF